jgi:membrane associated rhomboid family serine protease
MSSPRHRAWALGTSDAESVLAEARKALFVMVAFLAILWIVQLANVIDHYQLGSNYGIRPRDLGSLPDILSAPFLHVSWTHIESNSGPLFIFGFLAAYRGVVRFLGLTALVIVASGLAAWSFGSPNSIGIGASGVVFGYLGYILVRGFFDRHGIDIMLGAVMALCFAYQFTVLLPHAGIGWQAHIGGLVAGVAGGWIFRDRGARASARKQAKAAAARPETTAALPAAAVTASANPVAGKAGANAGANAGPNNAGANKPALTTQSESASEHYSGPRGDIYRQLDDLGL